MSYSDWQQARTKAINDALELVERAARGAAEAKMHTSAELQFHNLVYLERAFRNLILAIGYAPEEVARYDQWKQEEIKRLDADMKAIWDKWDSLEWKPLKLDDSERSNDE